MIEVLDGVFCFCSAAVNLKLQAVVLMSIRTLGDAWRYGWTARAVCQFMTYGKRSEHKNISCRSVYDLNLQSIIWTRGERFPRDQLESRLRCPKCGQMNVHVMWSVPNQPKRNAAAGGI